jgi:nucleotide-binding universal stress UspA family protein
MFETIFHPSDFSETSRIAFCHALKIALTANADLKMLHISPTGTHSNHAYFPGVRETLEQWGILEVGSHRSAVPELGMDVEKTIIHDDHFIASVSDFLRENPSSLVVLASHRRTGIALFGSSKSEPIARVAATTTLFVPDGAPGFISTESGEVSLQTIVVPVALQPRCDATITSVQHLVKTINASPVDIHLLHVGDQSTMPSIDYHSTNEMRFHVHIQEGDVVSTIIRFTEAMQGDLVAMTTDGHHGFLDALRGNTTEQVLRRINCPLWAVTVQR